MPSNYTEQLDEAVKKHSNWIRPMSTENDEMKNCSDDFKAGAAFAKAYESERVKVLVEGLIQLRDDKYEFSRLRIWADALLKSYEQGEK